MLLVTVRSTVLNIQADRVLHVHPGNTMTIWIMMVHAAMKLEETLRHSLPIATAYEVSICAV